jgi:hypothetical protein
METSTYRRITRLEEVIAALVEYLEVVESGKQSKREDAWDRVLHYAVVLRHEVESRR